MGTRVRPRIFDQVGHQTTYLSIGNKHFYTKSCHCQTYQNYEQSRQKLGTKFSKIFFKEKKSERFRGFLILKNDFDNQNFEMFKEVVHNFGMSDSDII